MCHIAVMNEERKKRCWCCVRDSGRGLSFGVVRCSLVQFGVVFLLVSTTRERINIVALCVYEREEEREKQREEKGSEKKGGGGGRSMAGLGGLGVKDLDDRSKQQESSGVGTSASVMKSGQGSGVSKPLDTV